MFDTMPKFSRTIRPICKLLPYGLVVFAFGYLVIRPLFAATADLNKALVIRAFDAQDRGDWALMNELYSPDFLLHSSLTPQPLTWHECQVSFRMARTKYPDVIFEVNDILAEGDQVAVRLSSTIRNVPSLASPDNPDGVLTVTEISILRIEDGCIVEGWSECDSMQLMQLQLLKTYPSS